MRSDNATYYRRTAIDRTLMAAVLEALRVLATSSFLLSSFTIVMTDVSPNSES